MVTRLPPLESLDAACDFGLKRDFPGILPLQHRRPTDFCLSCRLMWMLPQALTSFEFTGRSRLRLAALPDLMHKGRIVVFDSPHNRWCDMCLGHMILSCLCRSSDAVTVQLITKCLFDRTNFSGFKPSKRFLSMHILTWGEQMSNSEITSQVYLNCHSKKMIGYTGT